MKRVKSGLKYMALTMVFWGLVWGHGCGFAETQKVPKNEIYGAYRNALGEIGFFNYYGSMVLSPQFDLMWAWDDEVIILRDHGVYGALNYFGTPVVSFKYEFLDQPSNGTIIYGTAITFEGPRYYGLIDTKGNLIVEAQFDTVEKMPNGGIVTSIVYPDGRKYGVVFKNKKNFKPAYDEVVAYNDQYVVVKNHTAEGDKYGFISETGNYSHVVFDHVQITADGEYIVAMTLKNGVESYQLFDRHNAEVSRDVFSYISPKGFLDNDGNEKHFTAVRKFSDGKAYKALDLLTTEGILQGIEVQKIDYDPIVGQHYKVTDNNGLVGLVDSFGKLVLSPRYRDIEAFNTHYFVGVNESGRGVFDIKGEPIINFSNYDRIQLTEDDYVIAQSGNQFNVFDKKGMLQFQFIGDDLVGLGHNRFITKEQSPYRDAKGIIKYYYGLVNKDGKSLIAEDTYVYIEAIGENRLVLAKDVDGSSVHPSGAAYVRAPFADLYGVVDYDGKTILSTSFQNITVYKKGMLFAQNADSETMDAYNMEGKKINNTPLAGFDMFNWGSVTIAPYEKVRKSGYLNLEGSFIEMVYDHKIDDMVISQRLVMEDDLIHVVETTTELFDKQVIDNLVDETVIKGYILTKQRFGGEIYILKDKQWYMDTFYQQ
ncbi:MAG: WG repeat-containing protein [Clostridia bacterium]|nr:WG repeat-containing protein [Clostridia bacterium]